MSMKLISGHQIHMLPLSSSEFNNSQLMVSQGPLIITEHLSLSGSSRVPTFGSTP